VQPRPVREFCGAAADNELRVPRRLLARAKAAGWQLDVATGSSVATKTFTGSYGKPAYSDEGLSKAGPLLLTGPDNATPAEERRERFGFPPREVWDRLRYFAPDEVLALHGYPRDWVLPPWLETRRQWRLIGNSINVAVVQRLLKRLLAQLQ